MGVITSAGAKLFIASPGPLSPAPTWVEVGEITSIGEFGRVYSEVTFTALGDRNVRKFKGSRNDGTLQLQLGRDLDDAGQEDMVGALDSDDDYNFKIELNDAASSPASPAPKPTTITFKAKCMSFTTNIGSLDQVLGASCQLGIQSGSIIETAHTP